MCIRDRPLAGRRALGAGREPHHGGLQRECQQGQLAHLPEPRGRGRAVRSGRRGHAGGRAARELG
eukprot:12181058-Alexandrium_andersonii.AAC.1